MSSCLVGMPIEGQLAKVTAEDCVSTGALSSVDLKRYSLTTDKLDERNDIGMHSFVMPASTQTDRIHVKSKGESSPNRIRISAAPGAAQARTGTSSSMAGLSQQPNAILNTTSRWCSAAIHSTRIYIDKAKQSPRLYLAVFLALMVSWPILAIASTILTGIGLVLTFCVLIAAIIVASVVIVLVVSVSLFFVILYLFMNATEFCGRAYRIGKPAMAAAWECPDSRCKINIQ